jgi:hypothetical protein
MRLHDGRDGRAPFPERPRETRLRALRVGVRAPYLRRGERIREGAREGIGREVLRDPLCDAATSAAREPARVARDGA